jgi:hypothetical protein
MWSELRYRWALRKHLKDYLLTRRTYAATPPEHYELADGEPDIKRAQEKELTIQENEINAFRSKYLVQQAYLYHVPIAMPWTIASNRWPISTSRSG